MDEITFKVSKQADGWYLAAPAHERIGGATEAPDYDALKDKVQEFVRGSLRDGFHREVGLSSNPQIRLIYAELLFHNPMMEKVLITGGFQEERGYFARSQHLPSELFHQNFDALRAQLQREIREHGHHLKQVEFQLEEVIRAVPSYEARKTA